MDIPKNCIKYSLNSPKSRGCTYFKMFQPVLPFFSKFYFCSIKDYIKQKCKFSCKGKIN